jgi:glutamate-1-semialdehyde aminotransferase
MMCGKVRLVLGLAAGVGLLAGMPVQAWAGPADVMQVPQGPGGRINPLTVPGTSVSVSETPTGAAMTFTTSADRVDEVRARVRAMAARHNSGPQAGRMHQQMPDSRATAEDIPNGARLNFEPQNAGDLPQLRDAVRAHADWLRSRPAVPD